MFSFVSSLRRRFTTAALSSKYVQDMPPPGGFPIIDISKRLPGPRMSGAGLFLLLGLVMAYGKYYTYEGAAILHTWKDEKRAIRAVVYPFMQAEYDIRFLQKQAKFHEFERRVMEGVEGWEVGKNHYHTTWMHYNPGFGAWRKPFTGRTKKENKEMVASFLLVLVLPFFESHNILLVSSQNDTLPSHLAIAHFNARRVDFYPSLLSVLKCPINLTLVPAYSTTSLSSAMSLFRNSTFDSIVSDGLYDQVLVPLSCSFSNNTSAKIFSLNSSPDLELVADYPDYFRLSVSDDDSTTKMGQFITWLNVTKVALVHDGDPYLPEEANTALSVFNDIVDVVVFALSNTYALDQLEQTRLNVVFFFGSVTSLRALAQRLPASFNKTLWIIDTEWLQVSYFDESNQVQQLLDSSLRLQVASKQRSTLFPGLSFRSLLVYDSIMAAGLAACNASLTYHGLSGPIEFLNNGRNPSTVNFYITLNKSIQVGSWNDQDEFVPSSLLLELKPNGTYHRPPPIYMFLPQVLVVLAFVGFSFCVVLSLVCFIWINTRTVRQGQPVLMSLISLGCLVASFAFFALIHPAFCMVGPFAFFLGLSLALGAIIGKTYQLRAILKSRQEKKDIHVAAFILFLLVLNLVILVPFAVLDPAKFVWNPAAVHRDDSTYVTVYQGTCESNWAMYGPLCVLLGIETILLRSISSGERFASERLLAISMIQTLVYSAAIVSSLNSDTIGSFVVMSLMFFLLITATLTLSFYPLYSRRKMDLDSARKEIERKEFIEQSSSMDILEGLKFPIARERFAKYAEENYVIESYLFILDVVDFQDNFAKNMAKWRMDRARGIIHNYVMERALLQVNVSEKLREQTITRFNGVHESELTSEFFLPMLQEICGILNMGVWREFEREGGMFDVLPTRRNRPSSSSFRLFFPSPTTQLQKQLTATTNYSSHPSASTSSLVLQ